MFGKLIKEKHPAMNDQFIQQICINWNQIEQSSYLKSIDSIRNIRSLEFQHPITFFVGENGTGKSTLLEAMAVAYGFNPEGGTKNYNFSTYDSHSELCDALSITKGYRRAKWGYFLRAESFYNVATKEAEYAMNGGPSDRLHQRSHGESFLAVAQSQLRPSSIYFFDEPEAALSPQRQLTLLMEIYRCAQEGSQFFIATHSPILLATPGAQILSFDDGQIQPCRYEDTDSYRVTEMFIKNREQILRQLLIL